MVRRIVSIMLMVLVICNVAWAADASEDERQARAFIDKLKETQYLFDAGVNKLTYTAQYQALYIAYKKFESKQKYSPYMNEADKAFKVYSDISDVWNNSGSLRYKVFKSQINLYASQYDGFQSRIKQYSKPWGTEVEDLLFAIQSYSPSYIKEFEDKVDKTYKKEN